VLTVIGAATFGAGALAVWSRDRMVGLPTAWTSYAAYLRVGTMAVADSARSAFVVLDTYLAGALTEFPLLVIAAIAVFAVALLGRIRGILSGISAPALAYGLLVAHLLMLVLASVEVSRLFDIHSAVNTNLALAVPSMPDSASGIVKDVRIAVTKGNDAIATRVYGTRVLLLLLVGSVTMVLAWLHRDGSNKLVTLALHAHAAPLQQRAPVVAWRAVRPVSLVGRAILVTGLLMLPAAYGVVRLGAPPCVELHLRNVPDGESHPTGYLLTDLATNPDEVQLARWDTNERALLLDLHRRGDVRSVLFGSGSGCGTSLFANEGSPVESQ
jgi:hypothetical protein